MSGSVGKRAGSRRAPLGGEHHIVHYTLAGLLPPGQVLALNRELAILSRLAIEEDEEPWPRLLLQEQFSPNEERILYPLLEQYPHFCPHEALLANFYTSQLTDAQVERYRQRLQEARAAGVGDYELRPMRNILSRTRLRLRKFGIEVCSILDTGYMLKPTSEKPR
jgi:hypothetical protein